MKHPPGVRKAAVRVWPRVPAEVHAARGAEPALSRSCLPRAVQLAEVEPASARRPTMVCRNKGTRPSADSKRARSSGTIS